MAVQTRLVEYGTDGTVFEGFLAWDDSLKGRRPGVLISHTIRGRTAFEESKASALAELGYVAMALDVYGKDQLGLEERGRANMDALKADRARLQKRLLESLQVLATQPEVDREALGAIGYCFGGLCVLDLVRVEAPVKGVVSFHGLFDPPGNTIGNRSSASVLALHGWEDPLVKPHMVDAVARELTELGCDWQVHAYGHTMHAFTNSEANDSARGTVYAEAADRRSWLSMQTFLAEIFD